MEDYSESVVVGIAEDGLIEPHRFLLVATEEVNLYSADTNVLEPFHLLLAGYGVVHYAARSLGASFSAPLELYHSMSRMFLYLA